MRVTTKGRYALRAIANLAKTNGKKPVPIKKIAKDEDISPEFLEQIFFRLKKSGIIESVRGPGGGFTMNRNPADINLMEIFQAVGEEVALTPCTDCNQVRNDGTCPRINTCAAYSVWKEASSRLEDYFLNHNVNDLINTDNSNVQKVNNV